VQSFWEAICNTRWRLHFESMSRTSYCVQRIEITRNSFLSSEPFLIIGPERLRLYAHGGLIAQYSSVLAVDVDGPMREAKTKTIEIKHIDGDIDDNTVLGFIEYVYTGDYSVPEPVIALSSEVMMGESSGGKTSEEPDLNLASMPNDANEPSIEVEEPVTDGWGLRKSDKRRKKKSTQYPFYEDDKYEAVSAEANEYRTSRKEKLWSDFCSQASPREGKVWQTHESKNAEEDYTIVFLCHARLYNFCCRYDCNALMPLCLQKLRVALSRFQLHQERVQDIVNLIGYVYHHSTEDDRNFDKLKGLVIDYVVCHLESITKHTDFLHLLQEEGPLAKDLMTKTLERLD
jgi:hypothetical protein